MDAVDRKILAVLQENGRLTVTELAAHVGLSVSPCHRRLRELERSGVGKEPHERIVNALREHVAALKQKVG